MSPFKILKYYYKIEIFADLVNSVSLIVHKIHCIVNSIWRHTIYIFFVFLKKKFLRHFHSLIFFTEVTVLMIFESLENETLCIATDTVYSQTDRQTGKRENNRGSQVC